MGGVWIFSGITHYQKRMNKQNSLRSPNDVLACATVGPLWQMPNATCEKLGCVQAHDKHMTKKSSNLVSRNGHPTKL